MNNKNVVLVNTNFLEQIKKKNCEVGDTRSNMECYLELHINILILRTFNILIIHEKNKKNKKKLEKKERNKNCIH